MSEENVSVEPAAPVEQPTIDPNPLEDIFPDRHPLANMVEETPEPTAEPVEEPKVDKVPETTAEPEKPKEEPHAAPQIDPTKEAGLMAALMAEREKRQNLQRQLESQQQEKPKFDWDDPDKTMAAFEQKMEQRLQAQKLDLSEAYCSARHDDYGDKKEVFMRMAQENPALIAEMVRHPDPAEYAYNLASQRMFSEKVGSDPAEYEAKLRAEITAELEAKYKQAATDRQALSASLPPSAKSLTNKNTPVDTVDDDPLGSLFPGQYAS